MTSKIRITNAFINFSGMESPKKIEGLSLLERTILAVSYAGVLQITVPFDFSLNTKRLPKGAKITVDKDFKPTEKTLLIDKACIVNEKYIKQYILHKQDEKTNSPLTLGLSDDVLSPFLVYYHIYEDDKQSLKIAKKKLLYSLRKEQDTFLAMLFNRSISTFISSIIVNFFPFISPTMVTLGALGLGITGLFLIWNSTEYLNTVIGGICIYVSSLLDGVDGEVARLKYQFSQFGLWLDNTVDEYLNFMLIIVACLFSYHQDLDPIFLIILKISVIFFITGKIIQYVTIGLRLQPQDISQFTLPQFDKTTKIGKTINTSIFILSTIPRADMMKFMIMIASIFQFIPIYAYSTGIFSLVFLVGVIVSTAQLLIFKPKKYKGL